MPLINLLLKAVSIGFPLHKRAFLMPLFSTTAVDLLISLLLVLVESLSLLITHLIVPLVVFPP